jgi:hypothetical protein
VEDEIFDAKGRSDTEKLLASFRNLSKSTKLVFRPYCQPHREQTLSLSVVKNSNGEILSKYLGFHVNGVSDFNGKFQNKPQTKN